MLPKRASRQRVTKNMREARVSSPARWRLYAVVAGIGALVCVLLLQVAALQVLPSEEKGFEFLQQQGFSRSVRDIKINAYRGVITDRNGEPLAVSSPVTSIWFNPQEIDLSEPGWKTVMKELGLSKQELSAKVLKYRGRNFAYLQRRMTPADAEKILSLKLSGVGDEQEYRRFYPAGEVTAHLVGMTDIDHNGQEGMELAYDDWLSGEEGSKRLVKDLKGRVVREAELIKAAVSGQDLVLSIDLRLQYLAYRELKSAVAKFAASSGSAVVLDAHTGEVLAMVNQPSYNPNDRSAINSSALRNRALIDVFEPGSTMKPLTVLAALESGLYTPTSKIDTSPGYIRLNGKTLLDPVNYGEMDVTKIITKSSQVGISKIALNLEPESIRDMYYRLGLGQSTGTGFPGEGVGVLPTYNKWLPIMRANYAFGHGLNVTTLQLAQAYGVLAEHGKKHPVSLLKLDEPPVAEQVVESRYVDQVFAMLKTVTKKGGTATKADIPVYESAGKTGTVHLVGNGGYIDNRYLALFAGMAPANDPEIVVVVTVQDPETGKYYGGEVAAPVFAKIAEGALKVLAVPPPIAAHSNANQKNKEPLI